MWTEAAADFEAVTRNSIPHQAIYWMAQVALGDAYLKLNQPAEALRVFNMFSKRKQRIASLDRYNRRVNNIFGKLLVAAGRSGDAVFAFERSLAGVDDPKAPSVEEVRYELGRAYEANGKMDKATEQWKLVESFPAAQQALKDASVEA